MKKKKAYFKNLYRIIFKTKARFFSIFVIVFLGASFYAGLRHTPMIMRHSMDVFLNQHQFQDIELISTFGYDQEDIYEIEKLDYVKKVDYGYRFDALITNNDSIGVTVFTSNHFKGINNPSLVEGELPSSSNECLIDRRLGERENYKINDILTLKSEYKQKEYKIVGIVNDVRYISDPDRGVNSLGNGTNAGYILMMNSGNKDIAVDDGIFDLRDSDNVYTEIRVILNHQDEVSYFNKDYEDYVSQCKEKLESFIQDRHDDIYKKVIKEANEDIEDGEKKYQDGLKEYNDGIKQYEKGLDAYQKGLKSYQDGLKEYNKGLKEYNKGVKIFSKEISNAKKELEKGKKDLESNKETIDSNKKKVDQGIKESNDGLKQISNKLSTAIKGFSNEMDLKEYTKMVYATNNSNVINRYHLFLESLSQYQKIVTKLSSSLSTLKNNIDSIEIKHNDTDSNTKLKNAISQVSTVQSNCDLFINYEYSSIQKSMNQYLQSIQNYPQLLAGFEPVSNALSNNQSDEVKELKGGMTTIKESLSSIQEGLSGISEFDKGYTQYQQGVSKFSSSQNLLNKKEKKGQAKLNASKKKLDEAKKQLESAKKQLDKSKKQLDDANVEFSKAKKELDKANTKLKNAKEDIKKIGKADIISLTTKENAGIISFDSNSEAMSSISIIFPLIFFLVAALVSLTTMTRMVEEHRVQSGTLRALGYDKKDVILQYLIYGFLATFFACGIGIVFGTYFFSWIIYYLYSMMMYSIGAKTQFVFDLGIILQTYGISVAVILLVTWFVSYSSLKNTPSSLLRPKAPKMGKRILLERISLIWKRLSFNQKVTMRNIFRYKKRFFMSIVGIAGCTALMITGFGIKYSVSTLAQKQYGEVFLYNGEIGYKEEIIKEKALNVETKLKDNALVDGVVSIYSKTIETKGKDNHSYSPSIQIPTSFEEFRKVACLKDEDENELQFKNDGVYIDLKLSQLLDVKEGDNILITLENRDYQVKVNGIYTLYFNHYIIMSDEYYTSLTGEDVHYNTAQVKLSEKNDYQNQFVKDIKSISEIESVSYNKGFAESFSSMIDSLNSVVIILIICAAMLAFVVLYNLTNINIQERKSEIATIKVLGFYNKEVYDYVFRENTILACIGSLVGIVFGYFLHGYLINVVEIEMAHFIHSAGLMSYVYSVALTIVFTYFIDFMMRKVLIKIDMVESLKSVE